jgi:hypothetical protein
MPYRTFNGWLFDGSRNSKFPTPKYSNDGEEIIPDLLKYNSPITHGLLRRLTIELMWAIHNPNNPR